MTIYQIPLSAVASQSIAVNIGGQQCVITTRLLNGLQFFSLTSGGVTICNNVLIRNAAPIINAAYTGFAGDFAAIDLQGDTDPVYTGWGTRYVLIYSDTPLPTSRRAAYRSPVILPVVPSVSQIPWGPTLNWDVASNDIFTVRMTGDSVLAMPTSNTADAFAIYIRQDYYGNRHLTYAPGFAAQYGIAPVLSTQPNALDILYCISDGTNIAIRLNKEYMPWVA
jgi:hypothetical protein